MRLLRREPDTEVGHNAAGGWMVILLLALLCVQVGTGLCSNDDILVEGPLAAYFGKDRSDWLTHIHHVNFTLIEIANCVACAGDHYVSRVEKGKTCCCR